MMWLPLQDLFEAELQYTDRCAICGGPWHPASGQLVGSPVRVKVCGACFKDEIIPLIKSTMERDIRLSTRDKAAAAAARSLMTKAELKAAGKNAPKGKRISFYQHAAKSIGAGKP